MTWLDVGSEADLKSKGRRVVKAGHKQILLLLQGDQIFACNNRCPHEGYPLSEGTLGPGCTLTCNWHNWKFNLESGETLVGGDTLRQYLIEIRGGRIFVDVSDAPPQERQQNALINLAAACADNDYPRMAREIARYLRAEGDPFEPLRQTIANRTSLFEYGMGHAFAAAPEWIELFRLANTDEQRLVALVEPVAHIAWDTLREASYPYAGGQQSWNEDEFVQCVELEDEQGAIARLRGALEQGVAILPSVKRAFSRAALAHYQDFGHSAIYTLKAFELIEKLGVSVAAPALMSLTRSLIYASREDRIPEFRHYGKALADWGRAAPTDLTARDLVGLSVNAVLNSTSCIKGDFEEKYRVLLEACALAMLRFDTTIDDHVEKSVSHNVRWLDFTHALTFGNAVRRLCAETPSLWPQALLQMACFLGRNASFLKPKVDERWFVEDKRAYFERERRSLYDHGIREPIYACHRVKVLAAVAEEVAWAGPSTLADCLVAASNRYLNHSIKNHHVLRFAHQSLSFVAAEG